MDWVEHFARVNAVVTAHAIRIGRAVGTERRIVTVQTGIAMNARRDWKLAFRMRTGRRLPSTRRVTIAASLLEHGVPRKCAALEIVQMTADTLFRSADKDGRIAEVTLSAGNSGMLAVEQERVIEMSGRPTIIVVAAPALQWVEIILLQLV